MDHSCCRDVGKGACVCGCVWCSAAALRAISSGPTPPVPGDTHHPPAQRRTHKPAEAKPHKRSTRVPPPPPPHPPRWLDRGPWVWDSARANTTPPPLSLAPQTNTHTAAAVAVCQGKKGGGSRSCTAQPQHPAPTHGAFPVPTHLAATGSASTAVNASRARRASGSPWKKNRRHRSSNAATSAVAIAHKRPHTHWVGFGRCALEVQIRGGKGFPPFFLPPICKCTQESGACPQEQPPTTRTPRSGCEVRGCASPLVSSAEGGWSAGP
jgi:hypothetical protein